MYILIQLVEKGAYINAKKSDELCSFLSCCKLKYMGHVFEALNTIKCIIRRTPPEEMASKEDGAVFMLNILITVA